MKEERIQRVLEIENQARAVREAAVQEAAQLPGQAEKEAQALLEAARSEAEQKARQLIADAQGEKKSAEIVAQAEEKVRRIEDLARGNFDRAVEFVVARVIGRE